MDMQYRADRPRGQCDTGAYLRQTSAAKVDTAQTAINRQVDHRPVTRGVWGGVCVWRGVCGGGGVVCVWRGV